MSEILKSAAIALTCLSVTTGVGCAAESNEDNPCGPTTTYEYEAKLLAFPCFNNPNRTEVFCRNGRLIIRAIRKHQFDDELPPFKRPECAGKNDYLSKDETKKGDFQNFLRENAPEQS